MKLVRWNFGTGAEVTRGSWPRLGVLVEVNCETDFVARGDKFRSLVSDVAMQIAACPEVLVVDVADVPADLKQKEVDIEMQKEDILSKPEAIRFDLWQLSRSTRGFFYPPPLSSPGVTMAQFHSTYFIFFGGL